MAPPYWLLTLVLAISVGCGTDDGGEAEPAATAEAGTDAGTEAGTEAGTDVGTDVGTDAGIDAGVDVGVATDDVSVMPPELMRSTRLELHVLDIVYKPLETTLLSQARAAGARCLDGLGMLVHQGARSFEIWTGVNPPIDVMRRAVLERAG